MDAAGDPAPAALRCDRPVTASGPDAAGQFRQSDGVFTEDARSDGRGGVSHRVASWYLPQVTRAARELGSSDGPFPATDALRCRKMAMLGHVLPLRAGEVPPEPASECSYEDFQAVLL